MAGTREQTIPMREPQAILSNARSPQEFEALIQGAWQKETGRILEVGKLLLQAREQLLPAVFKGLRLPFKARMAQMLAKTRRTRFWRTRRTMVRCRHAGALCMN